VLYAGFLVLGIAALVILAIGFAQNAFLFTGGSFLRWGTRSDGISEYPIGKRWIFAAARGSTVILCAGAGLGLMWIVLVPALRAVPVLTTGLTVASAAAAVEAAVRSGSASWLFFLALVAVFGVVARVMVSIFFRYAYRMSRAERLAEDRETSMSAATRSAIRMEYSRTDS
jgi:hypothetical protein